MFGSGTAPQCTCKEMADCEEKCGDCSFDYGEDRQKGVCLIKEEYVDASDGLR